MEDVGSKIDEGPSRTLSRGAFVGLRSSVLGLRRSGVGRELGIQPFRLGLVLGESRLETLDGIGGRLGALQVRLMNSVAERLRGLVGELSYAKELEPELP